MVDYSLTMFDNVYPTQLYEHLVTYNNLVAQGYKDILLLGDSAGAYVVVVGQSRISGRGQAAVAAV